MLATIPETVVAETRDGPETLTLVGPSVWGVIYRSAAEGEYYRVLQPEEAPAAVISQAARWVGGPPKQGLAAIVEAGQSLRVDSTFVFVRYVLRGARNLAELWPSATPQQKLFAVARVAEALPQWWRGTARAALPMPADVLISKEGEAVLLPAPFRPPPDVRAVFAAPERARYLPAERLRDRAVASEDADDLHAVGAMLFDVLSHAPELDPEEALLRAANRTLFSAGASALPPWMERLDAIVEARAEAQILVTAPGSERMRVDPRDLAGRLLRWARHCDPVEAVQLLRREGKPKEALELLDEILRFEESLELLFEAAQLASDQGSILEGIEYLERAMTVGGDATEARVRQLQLIGRLLEAVPSAAEERERHKELVNRLEAVVWRDWRALPPSAERQCERVLSRYLLERGRYSEAARFIFPRLQDAEGTHLWWKFDLSLDYAEALMGLAALREAEGTLQASRAGLLRIRQSGTMTSAEMQHVGKRIADLERRLSVQKTPRSSPAAGGSA